MLKNVLLDTRIACLGLIVVMLRRTKAAADEIL